MRFNQRYTTTLQFSSKCERNSCTGPQAYGSVALQVAYGVVRIGGSASKPRRAAQATPLGVLATRRLRSRRRI